MALRSALSRLNLTRSWRACVVGASKSPSSVLSQCQSCHPIAAITTSLYLRQISFWPSGKNDSATSGQSDGTDLTHDAQTVPETVSQPTELSTSQIVSESQSTELSTSQIVSDTAADYLQTFHETISFDILPWAATIPIAAVALRLVSFPLVYYSQIHAGRFMLASKEFPRIQHFVRKTPGSLLQKYLTFRRLRRLTLQSAGTSPLRLFRWHMVLHLPLVIAASMGMRELARRVPDEWHTAGFGWITDLTASDPIGVLPVLTTGLWLWNLDPRTAPTPRNNSSNGKQKAVFERIISGTGESLARILQVVAVVSLSVTTELPAGILLFWFSNGVVTSVQRYALSTDGVRRALGLLTAEDLRQVQGPPVLQSTGMAVEKIREELSYVQREVLSSFKDRRVDEKLCREVNKLLNRERWSGRISVDLEAVVREDDRDGKKYVAIVRSDTVR